MSNNLQEVVRYVRSALDNHCVFVHMTAPQLETLLAGLEEQQRENESWADGFDELNIKITGQKKKIEKLRAENTAMKKALEFYASDYAQTINDEAPIIRIEYPEMAQTYYEMDQGSKARSILSTLSKEVPA